MKITKEEVKERFTKWHANHPCNESEFWHAQNAVGDILGHPEWWGKIVGDILDEK